MSTRKLKNIPAAIWDDERMEVTLLKRAMVSALNNGCAISYKDRAYLTIDDHNNFVILKSDAPETETVFGPEKLVPAVDQFFAIFYLEDQFRCDDIQFHHDVDINSLSTTWRFVKKRFSIEELLNDFHPSGL